MKAAKTAQRVKEDPRFESKLVKMVGNIHKLHNGYLEKHRSIYTDSATMRPYLLDQELGRRGRQPKYIQREDVVTVEKIAPAIQNDNGAHALGSSMLQSCGGFR